MIGKLMRHLLLMMMVLFTIAGGTIAMAEPKLTADMPEERLVADAASLLMGVELETLPDAVSELGGRDVVVTDLALISAVAGSDLGRGVRAGDPVVSVTFGLRRGFLQPDRRISLLLGYRGGKVASLVSGQVFAK
jgi:hypothetical protein